MHNCGRCGIVSDGYGPAGLCPRCLLLEGLGRSAASEPAPQSSPPPLHFGDYEIIEEVARGGMGIIYRARQLSLNRIVALKLMLAGSCAGPDSLRRFRTEAEAAASLQHPNIVAIHEVGEMDGQPFFTMDYVQGQNLGALVRDRPLLADQAAACLQTIAEAVHYAHQRGILHRDLKPSNILVDQFDQPRVTDFGLAKRLVAADPSTPPSESGIPQAKVAEGDARPTTAATDLTLTGQVLGSPNYLPPEQAEARHKDVGPASDVYSLGAVLYCLLTSRAPFQAATVADTLRQVSTAEPVSPRLLNPSVPKDLETICLKCLEKEIRRRYATARELADELGRFLRREPILARPIGAGERAWRWCRRKPVVAGLSASLALVLLAGLVGVTWQWRRAEVETRRAEGSEAEARRSLYTADINLAMRAHDENNRGRGLELLARHRPQPGQEDLRGWEWHYLWRQFRGGERLTLGEFPGAVTWVTFSRDSQRLAAGDISGLLRVWQAPFTQPPVEAQIEGGINSLAFLPDGSRLLLAHFYRRGVDLWGLNERSNLVTLRPRSDQWPHHMAALSPAGDRIAIVNDDGRFEVWDARALTNLVSFPGEKTCVVGVEWSPNGQWIASGEQPDRIFLRDSATCQKRFELPCPFGMPLKSFAFSPDGEFLAAAANDHTTRVWSTRSGKLAAALTNHTAWVRAVAFSPDGKRLATASGDQTLRLWNAATWQPETVLRGHEDEVHAVALSPNGQWLASGSKDGVVKLWDASPAPEPRLAMGFQTDGVALGPALAADGKTFFVWRTDGLLEIWDTLTFRIQRSVRLDTNYLSASSASAMAPGGAALVLGYEDGSLKMFELPPVSEHLEPHPPPARLLWTNSILPSLPASPSNSVAADNRGTAFSRLIFSMDGASVASSSEDHTLRVWDAVTGRERSRFDGQCRWHFALAFSPDGARLAAGNENRTIRWWRLPQGQLGGELREPRLMHIRGLAFSPNGSQLASASLDNRVRLWDLRSNTLARAFSRTLLSFRSVAFTPDGRRVLAGTSGEGQIMLWNVADGQEFGTLKTRSGLVSRLSFLPADTLVSLSGNEVRLWPAASQAEIDGSQR